MSLQSKEALAILLTNLQSPDNDLRSQAELVLAKDWAGGGVDARSALLMGLCELATQGELAYRPFAAVLLRRYSIKICPDSVSLERLADTVSPEVRGQIRSQLLTAFTADQTRDTRHKIADVIAEYARTPGAASAPWPDLLDALNTLSTNQSPDIREGVFRIFAAAPELVSGRPDLIDGVIKLLERGFADDSEHVRIAAANAFRAFFERLPKSVWKQFRSLLPSLLNVMEPLRRAHKSAELTAVLESLIDVAGLAPKMFQQVFIDVVTFALTVAGDRDLEVNTRLSALEFATTFADEARNMCKAEPAYVEKMVLQTLTMLMEVGENDDDAADWNNEDDHNAYDDEEEVHAAAKSSIDRVALKLGDAMVAPLFQWLPKMLSSHDWRERHAALMALSNAAEGCHDVMITELGKILDMVIPLLNDPHSRVQWAACNALGQMSTDFAEDVQKRHGSKVLPELIEKLSPQSTFRVQSHAAAAIFNFSENASKEILDPYLDDMLTRLLQLLQGPKRYVQEQVLATIAIVADAAKSKFIKYYDTLMPLLLQVLKSDTGNEYGLLKAKSIECSTLIALAAGREKFQTHFTELVATFAAIQQNCTPEDPCKSYLVQAWARLCRIMGPEFLPYVQEVMPPLLAVAKSKADYHILDEEQATAMDGQDGWEVYQASGQYVGLHTSSFEDKANAIELLCVYTSELGGDFYPWVHDVVQNVAIPSLSFFYYESVREAACQLIPHLIASTQQAAARGLATDAASTVLAIWKATFDKMIELMAKNETPGMLAEMYTCMFQSISLIGSSAVPEQVVVPLVDTISTNMEHLRERVQAREFEDNDEFIEDSEENAEKDDEELIDAVNKLIHVLFKILKGRFLTPFESLFPVLGAFLASDSENCLEWALCVIDDLIEYTGAESWKYHELFAEKLMKSLVSSSPRIRQAAAYGIGAAAQHGGQSYAQPTVSALETLFQVVNVPDARSDANIMATENSVSAIAKILRTHGTLLGSQLDMALREWVKALPIIDDSEAAPFPYLFLADLIDRKHDAVVSQIPHVFYSVSQALVSHSLSEKIADRVIASTKSLLSELPQEQVMELLRGLPAADQEIIQGVFQ